MWKLNVSNPAVSGVLAQKVISSLKQFGEIVETVVELLRVLRRKKVFSTRATLKIAPTHLIATKVRLLAHACGHGRFQ